VCFVGAHYLCYFRDFNSDSYLSRNEWKVYNDTAIRTLHDFRSVIIECAEYMQRPTLIFYERLEERGSIYSFNKLIESYDVRELERKAEQFDLSSLVSVSADISTDPTSIKL